MPNVEIERKFLVRSDRWQAGVVRSQRLRDGIVATAGGVKVRVRIADAEAFLTVKGARSGITRAEYEYPIPLADAEEMLAQHCNTPVVEKVRHIVPVGRHLWEVDVYGGVLAGVVIAEVELDHEDEAFERPSWVGEEVTGNPRWRKVNLLAQRVGRLAG